MPIGVMIKCYGATNGDVRAAGGAEIADGVYFSPEVSYNSQWYPVCGHNLWGGGSGSSKDAATTVCHQHGWSTGSFRGYYKWSGLGVVSKDAMQVGSCKAGERWNQCTGGNNRFGTIPWAGCEAGAKVGITIACSGKVPDGDVRAGGGAEIVEGVGFAPEVSYRSLWYPVCGHHFWGGGGSGTAIDGANTICNAHGFGTGTLHQTRAVMSVDAIQVGSCKAGERLNQCTGGDNRFGLAPVTELGAGGSSPPSCHAGMPIGVMIKCYGAIAW